VLGRENMLKIILHLFETDGDDIKRLICYFFSNMAYKGDPQQIFNLYKGTNIVRYYANTLFSENNKTVEVALDCLFVILTHG